MKNIVFLKSHLMHLGGLEKYSLKLAQAFAQKECDVTILTTKGPIQEVEGITVVPLIEKRGPSFYHLTQFDIACRKWLKNHHYDVIFGLERHSLQTHYRAGSGVHASYLEKRKLCDPWYKCATFKLNPLHRTILAFEKKTFQPDIKQIFTNSTLVKKEILERFPLSCNQVEVVHNGAPYEAWETHFTDSLKKPPTSTSQLLFIGNGYLRKGLIFLLKGLAQLKEKDFHLSIVGYEKRINDFKKLASELRLTDKVTFYGSQKEILPFYAAADVIVIPSLYDPFANVTVEALSMGLFVVSSPYNGASEVLTKESGCVIEDLTDPCSIAESLSYAMTQPKKLNLGQARRASIEGLDFSRQLDKIVCKTLNSC